MQPAVLQGFGGLFGSLPVLGHHMRRTDANLAGLAGSDFMILIVEDFYFAGGDRKTAGQEQFRGVWIMVALAKHRYRIALCLAVKLGEHRADPLDALYQPARRHRRSPIEQEFERGEIGAVERRMIEQHVDHGRHEQREVDPLACDGLEHRFRIETPEHVHGPAAHQGRQHLGAGHVADRRHREETRRLRNFEVRQDGAGETAEFAMVAQRAFGFSRGAAGIIQCRKIVRAGQTTSACRARLLERAKQIHPVIGRAEREHVDEVDRPGCELATAVAESIDVNDQRLCFRVLDLKKLILKRPQWMQPGYREPRQLRSRARAIRIGAVGGKKGDARAWLQPQPHEYLLHAADQLSGAAIGDRSAWPAEGNPGGVARQRQQGLSADGWKGVERVGHVFLQLFLLSVFAGANVIRR